MDIVHAASMEFDDNALKHRGGGVAFKHLFAGQENTPDNFLLVLSRQGKVYSPPHRHNFEQFRFSYGGEFSITPHLTLRTGEVGYFPEGTPYGPQDDDEGERILLVLQFGGPSGQGYLSQRQISEGYDTLSETGKFERGKYTPNDADGSPKDAFEAIWENHNRRPLEYPIGRYKTPILMRPQAYDWLAVAGAKGAWKKTLGVFSERLARAEMFRVEAGGTMTIAAENAIRLGFVYAGSGSCNGSAFEEESALRVDPGEAVELKAMTSGFELLLYTLPILEVSGASAARAA